MFDYLAHVCLQPKVDLWTSGFDALGSSRITAVWRKSVALGPPLGRV